MEFVPEHTPAGLDEFTRGYFEAVEWLLDDDIDRGKIRGFSRDAVKRGKADCARFQVEYTELLAVYREATGRDDACAGHDLYLSRNGHGSGFWDRVVQPWQVETLQALHTAARDAGETYHEVSRGRIVQY